ncbi:MAG: NADH-quinone oxidoreductase subunit A [Candidatus Cloacimonadota bacterium]|nr:MAG: NADH-quinone oxidoreductase subunit A [Candidatus Cloacimonadota bacterium]
MSDSAIAIVFILTGFGFVIMNFVLNFILSPKFAKRVGEMPYECGQAPANPSKFIQFDNHYYIFALLFVIFDVETVLFLPLLMAKGQAPWLALAEIFLFTILLGIGLAYVWHKNQLKWE